MTDADKKAKTGPRLIAKGDEKDQAAPRVDDRDPPAPRKEGHGSVHPPGTRSAPAVRIAPLRTPPSMRANSQGTPSISVLESAASPSLLSIAQAPISQRGGSLQFVCNDCWRTFSDGSLAACTCEKPRPAGGWAAMPYLFRKRYLFVELLGRGGMGAVFRAYDQAAHESPWVAVKVVQQSKPEISALLKEMFQKEVAAAQMLAQHRQFFVQVLGHDGVDPAYLVLEHVPWQTLEEMLTSLPGGAEWLPPVQVARIGAAVLRGVAKMHYHRIVHRDLTPSNIFIQRAAEGGEGYDVKITDLGIWTYDQLQSDSESLTLVGHRPTIEGTPAYMSPEQSTGEPVGAPSDLHTIGSVLWELATGVVPFPVSSGDVQVHDLVEQRATQLKNLPKRPAGMPEGLYKVLIKALAFDPTKRWASATEMRKALEAFVNQHYQQRQRDIEGSLKSIEKLTEQVASLKEKLIPMRGLLERLGNLGIVLREVREHRDEAEPEALRAIADSTKNQMRDIQGELIALASWLEFVGQTERRSTVRPPQGEDSVLPPPRALRAAAQQPLLERSPWMPILIAGAFCLVLLIGYLLGRPNHEPTASVPAAAPSTESAAVSETTSASTSSPPQVEPAQPAPVVTSAAPATSGTAAPAKSGKEKAGARGGNSQKTAPSPSPTSDDPTKNPYD